MTARIVHINSIWTLENEQGLSGRHAKGKFFSPELLEGPCDRQHPKKPSGKSWVASQVSVEGLFKQGSLAGAKCEVQIWSFLGGLSAEFFPKKRGLFLSDQNRQTVKELCGSTQVVDSIIVMPTESETPTKRSVDMAMLAGACCAREVFCLEDHHCLQCGRNEYKIIP